MFLETVAFHCQAVKEKIPEAKEVGHGKGTMKRTKEKKLADREKKRHYF